MAEDFKVYKNAMVPLIAHIGGNLTGSKEQKIFYKKPSGTEGSWTAAVYGDVTNGEIMYSTTATDLDETGTWLLQGYEKDSADRINKGETYELEIYEFYE